MISVEIPHIWVTLNRLNSLYLIFRCLYLDSDSNSRKRDYGFEMEQEEHSEGTGERKGEGEKMELYFNFKKIPLKSIHCFYIRYTLLEWLVVAEKTYSLFWNSTHSLSTQPLLYCKLSPVPAQRPTLKSDLLLPILHLSCPWPPQSWVPLKHFAGDDSLSLSKQHT